MSALPPLLTVVLRDVSTSYPLPVTAELAPPSRDGQVGVRISTDGESSVEVRVAPDGSVADQIADVADQVADWLVEQLPAEGHPAVWPECPLHPGTHPLMADSDGREASWLCPATREVVARIGELR